MICEICVDSVAGVRAAKDAGAQRVELCADLLEGGITPSLGMIRQARKVAGIDLNVMIRPRGGDFLFNDDEFATMRADIETAKAEGANGVVIGLLTAAGEIDALAATNFEAQSLRTAGDINACLTMCFGALQRGDCTSARLDRRRRRSQGRSDATSTARTSSTPVRTTRPPGSARISRRR